MSMAAPAMLTISLFAPVDLALKVVDEGAALKYRCVEC